MVGVAFQTKIEARGPRATNRVNWVLFHPNGLENLDIEDLALQRTNSISVQRGQGQFRH